MRCLLLFTPLLASTASVAWPEIIDKVVAVVGRQAITASEVEQQIRLQAFFNDVAAEFTPEKQRQELARLIERRLLQQELAVANFGALREQEVSEALRRFRQREFYGGRDFASALQFYQLTEGEVAEFLAKQIRYQRYWEFRFRAGIEVTRQEVEAYYEQEVVPEYASRQGSGPPPLEQVYREVEERVAAARADAAMDVWLKEARAKTRVVILDPALRPGGQ